MRRACRQVEPLLARAAKQLDERERGMLAQHLDGCADCRARDRLVTALFTAASDPMPLSQTARERAMSRAFVQASVALPAAPARPTRAAIGLTVAVAAAAMLVVGLRLGVMAPGTNAAPRAVNPVPSAVESVALATGDDATATAPEDDRPYEATTLERRAFAGAEVTLTAGSSVRFQKAKSTVVVARGEVSFEVEKRTSSPFVVTTQNFRVEVLGTQFSVSPERVSVSHGRVAVRSVEGDALLAELGAGESYLHGEASQPGRAAYRGESVAHLLGRAREALGKADVALAHALLSEVARRRSSRSEQAEAGTLRAECALVEHDAQGAIRSYLEVAGRFADLSAGENAAFAAAQLSARADGKDRARLLYQRYLSRYPKGRFVDEARTHLGAPVGK